MRLDPAFGPLAEHCVDDAVTDVFVNGAAGLFVDRGSGAEPVPTWSASEREVRDLAVALVGLGGRHLDDQAPCVDVRLDTGIRVHAVLAPVSATGTALSIRIPRIRAADLDALGALGAFDARQQSWLHRLVADRANILITGGTGTGKTTLLSALLSEVSPTERIVTIEDVAELRPRHPHHVALEARQANLEGAGGISLARLVRESLRMRPDRLVVGECRGEEVRELLTALNTGHDGGAGTLHASGLRDVPARLEALGALAGMDATALARQAVSAFSTVLHLERTPDGVRRISRTGTFVLTGDRLDVEEVTPW
ncbi:TadA family conjugal transfer-associated ATPase [Microbacterium sp. 179-I 3D2 NHS]